MFFLRLCLYFIVILVSVAPSMAAGPRTVEADSQSVKAGTQSVPANAQSVPASPQTATPGSKTAPSDAKKGAADPGTTAPGGKQLRCWRIEQDNMLFGQCTIYACDQALKVVFKNGKWMNLARAPGWELYVFNPREKVYYHTPLDKWKANSVQLGLINSAPGTIVTRTTRTQRIAGQVAVQFLPLINGKPANGGNCWIARDIVLPDQVYHVLCGNALLPQLHGLPLRVCVGSAELSNSVDTKSCVQTNMPASFFDLPKGYQLTAKPEDVMNTGIMDVVKDMTGY